MKLRILVEALQEKKASDVLVLDLRGKTSFCDWFVLCSGNTPRHVQAMANGVLSKVRTDHHMRPIGAEGLAAGRWALLDYDDVLVHIFEAPLRRYYDLEGLWLDAGRADGRARPGRLGGRRRRRRVRREPVAGLRRIGRSRRLG